MRAENGVLNKYSVFDSPPVEGLGVGLYYRIVSVDRDGRVGYSEIKQIRLNELTNKLISIFPNPAKDVVNVTGKDIKEVKLFNYLGVQIATGTNLGNDVVSINLKQFAKGVYVIQVITAKDEVRNEKLIVE